MIKTFADKRTEALFDGTCHRQFRAFRRQAEQRLTMLDAAIQVEDLTIPSSNHLERFRGDRAGQWSVRINKQWRICFSFKGGNAFDVEIIDYH